jgi:hypothetical protein
MTSVTRHLGLSLGADICWPLAFEQILADSKLAVKVGRDLVRFDCERTTLEPFDLQQRCKYDVVVDRLTHWLALQREWIKKSVLMDGLYVYNNPWSVQSYEKHSSYCAMLALGMPIPRTIMVPQKNYPPKPDLDFTLKSYARMFDLGQWGRQLGYPLFMKPYDGGGWMGVSKVDDEAALRAAYEKSGRFVMHLQRGVIPFERFVRGLGLGPQVRVIDYDPTAPLHGRYLPAEGFLSKEDESVMRDLTLTINSFFGWDFNSCEALLKDGVWHPIDFANPCPDSQVTSLHVHFPWLVKAKIRWALFCAATKRKMRMTLDWQPYFEIAASARPYREKLAGYAKVAHQRFETDRFEEFCERHLASLDEIAWEYFGTERAREAIRKKVQALFPEHEWNEFTEHFWHKIQEWRERESARTSAAQE